MRDFVRESWKIAAAFAVGAFLLSLLIGLLTRNPFGVVLLRALLLALLFAGFGAGLRFTVRTWLPELAGQPGPSGTDARPPAADVRGSKVDIVVGDDDARPGREAYESAEEVPSSGPDATPGEARPAGFDESATNAEAAALGELTEELSAAEDTPVAEAVEGDRGEEPSELPGASVLDSLPDIELQGESTGTAKTGAKGRRPRAGASGITPSDAVRESVARQDPATLARALRTVLKKDEKG